MWLYLRFLFMAFFGLSAKNNLEQDKPIMAGLVDIKKETIEGKVEVDKGTIPDWLNG